MAQAVRHNPISMLLADRRAHPLENGFAAATLLLGVIAFATALAADLHVHQRLDGPGGHPHGCGRPVHLGDDG